MASPSVSTASTKVAATVQAELHNQLFRLITEDGTTLIAGLSAEAKRLGVAITIGMNVEARIARLDPGRATILGPLAAAPARNT